MGKTFVYNSGKEDTPGGEIWKEYGLFFDGTLNNKDNTELREKVEKGIATALELEIYKAGSKRGIIDEQGVDNSYSNDSTNVVRLWEYCEKEYKIYVEGIGTITKAQDDSDGFMFGAGIAGIRQKVRKGCKDLAEKIGEVKIQSLNSTKKITRITIDVFGFSRGAAAARNFLHEVNVKKAYMPDGYLAHKANEKDRKSREETKKKEKELKMRGHNIQDSGHSLQHYKQSPIKDDDGVEVSEFLLTDGLMPKMGHLGYMLRQNGFTFKEIEDLELVVRFVGVYDTVSSYYKEKSTKNFLVDQLNGDPWINKYFADDINELQLVNLGSIQKAVHFTAMDEHRYNFALTTFPGAIEKKFPGVHCDIGGAYLNEEEKVDEIEVAFTPSGNIAKYALQKSAYLMKKGFWGTDAKIRLDDYRLELIHNSWFKGFQININDINTFKYKGKDKIFPKALNSVYDKLSSKRTLRKEYSYIPLLFMETYFSETLDTKLLTVLPLQKKLLTTYSVDSFPILAKAKDYLKPYVIDNIGGPWDYNAEEYFKIKEEIAEKKKRRLLKNAEDAAKNSKREYKYPASKQDDGLASQNNKNQIKLYPFEQKLNDDPDVMQDIIEEKELKLKSAQGVLELLRNEYFHWSANKDWFGMNPTESRGRTIISPKF